MPTIRNSDLESAVHFLTENSRKYPWHKLTGPNFELDEWKSAIQAAREGCYYRVLFRPEKELQPRNIAKIPDSAKLEENEATETLQENTANEFKKIPTEMHQTLENIIRDALPDEDMTSGNK